MVHNYAFCVWNPRAAQIFTRKYVTSLFYSRLLSLCHIFVRCYCYTCTFCSNWLAAAVYEIRRHLPLCVTSTSLRSFGSFSAGLGKLSQIHVRARALTHTHGRQES